MVERSIVCAADEVRRLLADETVELRCAVKPQPPSIEDVRAKSGSGYDIFTDERTPGVFRVAGPVWAVRELLGNEPQWSCPFGVAGERRWVKETWADADVMYGEGGNDAGAVIAYRADKSAIQYDAPWPRKIPAYDIRTWNFDVLQWRSSIHMPRWASRAAVIVDAVRCERGTAGAWEWVVVVKRADVRDS